MALLLLVGTTVDKNTIFFLNPQPKLMLKLLDRTNSQFTLYCTVVPTKSGSHVIVCLQLLSETITCTLHFCLRESIDHLCINPILRIGLMHK